MHIFDIEAEVGRSLSQKCPADIANKYWPNPWLIPLNVQTFLLPDGRVVEHIGYVAYLKTIYLMVTYESLG